MKKVVLIIVGFLSFVYIAYLLSQRFYHKKFEKTETNSSINSTIKEWGKPSEQFYYGEDEIVFFYKKDWLGWEKYAFVFNKKDSLLVRKSIDD